MSLSSLVPADDLDALTDALQYWLDDDAARQTAGLAARALLRAIGGHAWTFAGSGQLPDELAWDWLDDTGTVIAPGVYQYRLYWTDQQGERHASNRRKVYVQKFLRKVTVRVTRDIEPLQQDADRIELRIQH